MAKKEEETPETPELPDPWAIISKLTEAIQGLARAPQNDQNQSLTLRLTEALERVSEAQLAGSKLIASETRRAHRPSNEVVPNRSVFNRRGTLLPDQSGMPDGRDPRKPLLKCVMMIPWLVEWESCTREEVELLNLLGQGEYTLRRIDNSKIRVTVKIDYKIDNVSPSRLVLTHETGFNNDNFKLMPALPDMLRQLLRQHPQPVPQHAILVMTDEEEEALIEAGALLVSQ